MQIKRIERDVYNFATCVHFYKNKLICTNLNNIFSYTKRLFF